MDCASAVLQKMYLHGKYANMQNKLDLATIDVLARLRQMVLDGEITQQIIQSVSGVHQTQISRILSGQIKRVSKNVVKLCKFEQELHKAQSTHEEINPRVRQAVEEVWDGTELHAEAIAKVIRSLKGFPRGAISSEDA